MFCALGKYDQKIYVAPSTGMVVVRLGGSADSVADALTAFDNELWGYIDSLPCTPNAINDVSAGQRLNIYPNPTSDMVYLDAPVSNSYKKICLYNLFGVLVAEYPYAHQIDLSRLAADMYILRITDEKGTLRQLAGW